MCGLFGLASPSGFETNSDLVVSLYSKLALLNEQRGRDATGFALISKGNSTVWKRAATASEVIIHGPVEWRERIHTPLSKLARTKHAWIALGHTRAATSGTPKDSEHAHPFLVKAENEYPQVIGTHNGVVAGWQRIAQELKLSDDLKVDSQIIFEGLHRAESESTLLSQLVPVASLALSYVIRPSGIKSCPPLRLYRCQTSSLALAILPAHGLFVWSSSLLTLQGAVAGLFPNKCITIASDGIWVIDLENPPKRLSVKILPETTKRPKHEMISFIEAPEDKESPFAHYVTPERIGVYDYFDDWDYPIARRRSVRRTEMKPEGLCPAVICEIQIRERKVTICMNPEHVTTLKPWERSTVNDPKTSMPYWYADVLLSRFYRDGELIRHYRRFYRTSRLYTRAFESPETCSWYSKWLNKDAKLAEIQAINRKLADMAGWVSPYENDPTNQEIIASRRIATEAPTPSKPNFDKPNFPGVDIGSNYVPPYSTSKCSMCGKETWSWALLWLWGYPHCTSCYDKLDIG